MSENLVEKYATKTYIDKDYKDIVVSEKSFVNLVRENKKQKEVLNRLKVVYTSMQFSAPENMYTFIEQMGELLEEIE